MTGRRVSFFTRCWWGVQHFNFGCRVLVCAFRFCVGFDAVCLWFRVFVGGGVLDKFEAELVLEANLLYLRGLPIKAIQL